MDHVGIAVADLLRAKAFLHDVLGPEQLREATVLGVATAFFDAGPAAIEVLEPLDEAGRRTRLGGADARIDHIAMRVDDLAVAADGLCRRGVRFPEQRNPDVAPPALDLAGVLSLFTDAASSGGVTDQLVERRS